MKSSEIIVLSNAGARDLIARIERVILVPAAGPIAVFQVSPRNAFVSSSTNDGRRISSIKITIGLPPDGAYRVLVEDRDLSAPSGCPISFIVAIGSLTVRAGAGVP